MNTFLKAVLVLISFAVCAGVSYGVYQYSTLLSAKEEKPTEKIPQAVEATRIVTTTISDRVELVGTLEADAEANIRPRSAGYITKLPYDVGDYVEAGTVVVELDQSQAQEAYLQAEAALTVREKERDASQTQLNQLAKNLERAQQLLNSGAITRQEFEEVQAQHDVAEANRDLQIAMVKQAESAKQAAGLMKQECKITTSISGYVAERVAEVGDLAAPVDVLMRIVDLRSVYTVVYIVEKDYGKIRHDQRALIEVDAYPGKTFEGTVERIAPQIEIDTRTAAVKIQIGNQDGYLKPGMYARVSLQFEEKPDAKVIPMATILEGNEGSYVYIADEADEGTSIVRKQTIETGIIDGEQVEVIRGITPEDRIISLGNRLVKEGDRVDVKQVVGSRFPESQYRLTPDVEVQGAE